MPELWEEGQGTALSISGPAGKLEAILETPKAYSQPQGVALVCHPHPQFGGAMTNKVAHALARSALGAGLAALRFNFRGVGTSEGSFADGIGETEDAATVYEWIRGEQPQAKILLAGFSFGAAVALRLAARVEAAQLITIAPPLRYFEGDDIPVPDCPWLVVHGDADDVVDCADTLARLRAAGLHPQQHVMAGAGHFFHGRLPELRDIVSPAIEQRWTEMQ